MNTSQLHWSIPGADGQPILVSTDVEPASAPPRCVVLLAHGFKGYKDYGFIPVLGHRLAHALPTVVHRFNFSHSGMTNDIATFANPDLFERDTWNKQVFDLDALIEAVSSGQAPGTPTGLPIVLVGHSRGGVSCLLCAGRRFRDGKELTLNAVVTLSAPDKTSNLAPEVIAQLREQGYLASPSSRTGQVLRVGRIWFDEQEASPTDHDVLGLVGHIRCPVLTLHGQEDQTVDPACASHIASACPRGESTLIPDGDHVYCTTNPADVDGPMSEPLTEVCTHVAEFIESAVTLSR
jgi:uncharacterized protein